MRTEFPLAFVRWRRWATVISVFMLMLSAASSVKGCLMNDGDGFSKSQWYEALKRPNSEA